MASNLREEKKASNKSDCWSCDGSTGRGALAAADSPEVGMMGAAGVSVCDCDLDWDLDRDLDGD